MTKCRDCGADIEFKDSQKTGKKYPVNASDESFHNCRKPADMVIPGVVAPTSPSPTKSESLGKGKGTRWDGIKQIQELDLKQTNLALTGGWVVLDRVERLRYADFLGEVRETSESVYIVGWR